jgi:hypothetical protein
MKNTYKIFTAITALTLIVLSLSSCQKDKDGNPPGTASEIPVAQLIRPDSAAGNNVIILEGTGLAEVVRIVFEKNNVPATFNPTLNTETALVFRVPDTAFGGNQKIIFTNKLGVQFSVPFKVIALPSIASVSSYSWSAGETVTLTGNNLDDVTSIQMENGGQALTLGAKNRKSIKVTFPASTVTSTKLKITNSSGTITTTQEFINADQAYVFFRDSYANGHQDASWGDPGGVAAQSVSGVASYGKKYQKGNWHLMGFGWNNISQGSYKYLSFWMKGGLIDHEIFINTNQSAGGVRAYNSYEKINVLAEKWQYFKLDVNTLKLWQNGSQFNQIAWSIKGPDNDDETMFLDDVMLIK